MKLETKHIIALLAVFALFIWIARPKIIFGNEMLNSIRHSYQDLDEKTKEYLDKYYREIGENEKIKMKDIKNLVPDSLKESICEKK